MGPLSIFNHLCNFLLPALVVGLLVALVSPRMLKRKGLGFVGQTLINFVSGGLALAAGLWFFGTDAKMATYLGMVLLIASVQWISVKGWQG